jgi:hypothetical protein
MSQDREPHTEETAVRAEVAQTRWDAFYNQAYQRVRQDRAYVHRRVAKLVAHRLAAFVARFVVCTSFGVPGIVAVALVSGAALAPERTIEVMTTPMELQYAALAVGGVGLAAGFIVALIMAPVAEPSIRQTMRREQARIAEDVALREWQGWVEQELSRARAARRPARSESAQTNTAAAS